MLHYALSPPRRSALEGATSRLIAALAEPRLAGPGKVVAASRMSPFTGEVAEDDAQYFRRRSAQERRAADQAAGPEARAAHDELAARYARLSERPGPRPKIARSQFAGAANLAALLSRRFGRSDGAVRSENPRKRIGQSDDPTAFDRKRHLDERLDQALLETFPASDPVSFAHIR